MWARSDMRALSLARVPESTMPSALTAEQLRKNMATMQKFEDSEETREARRVINNFIQPEMERRAREGRLWLDIEIRCSSISISQNDDVMSEVQELLRRRGFRFAYRAEYTSHELIGRYHCRVRWDVVPKRRGIMERLRDFVRNHMWSWRWMPRSTMIQTCPVDVAHVAPLHHPPAQRALRLR